MSINMLNLGLGDCGCRIVNEGKLINNSFDCAFINSNINGTNILENSTLNNTIHLESINGAAKNRNESKEAFKKSEDKIMIFLNDKIYNYSVVNVITSIDGGTGSGITKDTITLIRELNNTIKINLIAVCPDLHKSKRIPLKNSISFYSDFLYLLENNIINGYMYVDNQKIGNGNINEFNKRIMEDLLGAYEISFGDLDESDITTILSKNYTSILKLNNALNIDESIKAAVITSPFMIEDPYIATHIGISVDENSYNPLEVLSKFKIRDFEKNTNNPFESNFIILGGCKPPNQYFKKIENKINSIENNVDSDYMIDYYKPEVNYDNEEVIVNKKQPLSKKELRRKLKGRL